MISNYIGWFQSVVLIYLQQFTSLIVLHMWSTKYFSLLIGRCFIHNIDFAKIQNIARGFNCQHFICMLTDVHTCKILYVHKAVSPLVNNA